MSRILHLVNMGLRYSRSKGVQVSRLEDGGLGNLAAPCHLEENASHHVTYIQYTSYVSGTLMKTMLNYI